MDLTIRNVQIVGKLLLEPKASSKIVFTASVLAFLFSLAVPSCPGAVVMMEAIGWSGLAHLVAVAPPFYDDNDTVLTVSADAEEDYSLVVEELRSQFLSTATTRPSTIPLHIR